jgi:hypothetical protein
VRIRAAAAVLVVPLAALVLACGASGSSPNAAGPQDPMVASSAAAAAAPTGPVTAFGDGTYEIGTGAGQVPPGKYKTTVPADSAGCYWERLKGLSGAFADIAANGNSEPGAPAVVTIAKTDAGFKSQRCGTWQKA